MRTGLHLGLVAARPALSGQAARLSPLGHPLVPGGDGLAAVVTADKHLRTRDRDYNMITLHDMITRKTMIKMI